MGTNHVESSLKRFLKRKVKVTLGLVVAFMITGTVGFGATIDEPITANGENKIIVINEEIFNVEANKNIGNTTYVLHAASKGKIDVNSKYININSESDARYIYGIVAEGAGILNVGNNETEDISITVSGTENADYVLGVYLDKANNEGGFTNITGKNVKINVNGKKEDALVTGVYCITRVEEDSDKNSKIDFNTENLEITATGSRSRGIVAWSKGKVFMNKGNISITAEDVIHTRLATVEINAENKAENVVKLNGNINFEYANNSGTDINSDVIINLSNKDSIFNGKIIKTYKDGSIIPDDKNNVNGMKLGLSNGGTWNVTGDSFVNDLTVNNGVINVTDKVEKEISVDRLHGNGGTVTFETDVAENGDVSVAQGNLNIKEVEGTPRMRVGFSGINADDLVGNNVNLQEAFNQLADKVTVTTGEVEETYFAQEGAVVGEITAVESKDGKMEISQEKSSNTVAGLRDLATINYLSWKQEMGSLTQRMGELRNSSAEHGVWARVYGGKVENGSRYDNEYQTYQVGYDKKYSVNNGNIFLGYLISYTDGETNYELGNGENYSVGAGMYATWMNNNGHYVDVLYKVSRLNNKFDVNGRGNNLNSKGEYDTYGISLSGEYGKRFDLTEKWFIEPNVGMHFGRLGDETYTTNSGIEVSQDSIYTAEGRIGTSVGYKFGNGNVYARAHAVKEFAGDIDSSYTANGVTVKESEDLSDTWLEFGVGTNYRFAKNVNVYLDLEKSGDAAVDTEWQANLGFRWEF